jgi:spore maturation protein CgeB
MSRLRILILGLSITSSWGNGHATTYRGLTKALSRRGHTVTFLERDVPWYAAHRDERLAEWGDVHLYTDVADLRKRFHHQVAGADAVIVGSYVAEGPAILGWVLDIARGVVAFYDIDTPVTVARLQRGDEEYVSAAHLPHLDLYLSFTGGPLLEHLCRTFGVRRAVPLYCAVDPDIHRPEPCTPKWDLGYLGTYSSDRQPKVETLLNLPARRLPHRRFVIAGPQYPAGIAWPANVERIEHLSPDRHRHFYCSQRFTLNVTRADMVAAGWSPSVRLFEAAACGVPIISDAWPGLATLFVPGTEILIADGSDRVAAIVAGMSEDERCALAAAARRRVLASHSAACRAQQLEDDLCAARSAAAAAHPIPTSPFESRQQGEVSWPIAGTQAQ